MDPSAEAVGDLRLWEPHRKSLDTQWSLLYNRINHMQFPPLDGGGGVSSSSSSQDASASFHTDFERVRESMHSAISMNKTEILDAALDDFSEERNLRHSLKPMYEVLFERLNTHPGGLRFLSIMRADILSFLAEENIPSLRALDSYLKEKLITWLSPANLQLHHITWDDSASLLEKIVAYEAVHPISNLLDLKRRLGVGRRCFGYLTPAIPGEPLIFIEVALMKTVAQTIQEVLWDDPPTPENEATCALFYSISSTQTFATLSPIPGYMQWLLSKLASVERSGSAFRENLLKPEEESALLEAAEEFATGKNGMEVMRNLLSSTSDEWAKYLLQEKKRGKALDSVGNFHLQNGAMVGRINWMADRSEKGLRQSAGLMVNYIYKVDHIEENAQSYFSKGEIQASDEVRAYLEPQEDLQEEMKD
ncbi:UNVERIFIED_CONTAM: Malonyl-CoA decarboxylase, mitochondrial [Sesamum latifolium]|uniref:Malonyl-CoA decarboxylase, mitochondrial n=1 Tax=Sesamum latifolium TaxID=2727402 RepID=A0AAW2TSI4_9LAMI